MIIIKHQKKQQKGIKKMNKVILIGRLTRDPELKTTTTGVSITTFSIAVERNYVNEETGQRDADFINCQSWRKQAENIARYCNKGSQIALEGRLQVRSYDDRDGNRRFVTEVVADNVTFLSPKKKEEVEEQQEESNVDFNFEDEIELTEDDLPFDIN